MKNWKVVTWLLHWNNNHWVLYVANKHDHTSSILDPASRSLMPALSKFKEKLDKIILDLTYTLNENKPPFKTVTYEHPIQNNNYDCGVFSAHFATEYCQNPKNPIFTCPNAKHIRQTMLTQCDKYMKFRKLRYDEETLLMDNKTSPLYNRELVNRLGNGLEKGTITPDQCLTELKNHIVKVIPRTEWKPPSNERIVRSQLNKDTKNTNKQYLIKKFNKFPKKTFEEIIEKAAHISCSPTTEELDSKLKKKPPPELIFPPTFKTKSFIDTRSNRPIEAYEVRNAFEKLKVSSPGNDQITFGEWKNVDPSGVLLSQLFTAILKSKTLPAAWKSFRTTMILKPGKTSSSNNVSSWRPIAILDTIYRIFAKVMNRRILSWIFAGNLISAAQKAIGQPDGCSEHNFLLTSMEEEAIRSNDKEIHMAFLDLTDAFGSVPHQLIWKTLELMGLNEDTISMFKNMYTDTKTTYFCNGIQSSPIDIVQGVKQGCPLSMTLFSISIDFILKSVEEMPHEPEIHKRLISILAYADDLVIISNSNDDLQEKVNRAFKVAAWAHLHFNASKCGYYTTSKIRPQNAIRVGKDVIQSVNENNLYKYLGVPHGEPKRQDITDIIRKAEKDYKTILESGLTMKQKTNVMKIFINPRFIYALRTHAVSIMTLYSPDSRQNKGQERNHGFDLEIAGMIKNAFKLPLSTTNDFIYTCVGLGGMGITPMYEEHIVQTVNQMFRVLNSNDVAVKWIAKHELIEVASKRIRGSVKVSFNTALRWLCKIDEENLVRYTRGTWWTRIRDAIERAKNKFNITVTPTICDEQVHLKLEYEGPSRLTHDITMQNRDLLCSNMHELLGTFHFDRWCSLSFQGSIISTIAKSPFSLEVYKDKDVSDALWKFAIRARMECLYLADTAARFKSHKNIYCRRCHHLTGNTKFKESQWHVLGLCQYSDGLITRRHDILANMLHKVLIDHNIDADLEISPPEIKDSKMKPDIVVRTKKHNYFIDMKCPYDLKTNIEETKARNKEYYKNEAKKMTAATKVETSVHAIVVGALGSWDPENNKVLKFLKLKKKVIEKLARRMTVEALRESQQIYNFHVSIPMLETNQIQNRSKSAGQVPC